MKIIYILILNLVCSHAGFSSVDTPTQELDLNTPAAKVLVKAIALDHQKDTFFYRLTGYCGLAVSIGTGIIAYLKKEIRPHSLTMSLVSGIISSYLLKSGSRHAKVSQDMLTGSEERIRKHLTPYQIQFIKGPDAHKTAETIAKNLVKQGQSNRAIYVIGGLSALLMGCAWLPGIDDRVAPMCGGLIGLAISAIMFKANKYIHKIGQSMQQELEISS